MNRKEKTKTEKWNRWGIRSTFGFTMVWNEKVEGKRKIWARKVCMEATEETRLRNKLNRTKNKKCSWKTTIANYQQNIRYTKRKKSPLKSTLKIKTLPLTKCIKCVLLMCSTFVVSFFTFSVRCSYYLVFHFIQCISCAHKTKCTAWVKKTTNKQKKPII